MFSKLLTLFAVLFVAFASGADVEEMEVTPFSARALATSLRVHASSKPAVPKMNTNLRTAKMGTQADQQFSAFVQTQVHTGSSCFSPVSNYVMYSSTTPLLTGTNTYEFFTCALSDDTVYHNECVNGEGNNPPECTAHVLGKDGDCINLTEGVRRGYVTLRCLDTADTLQAFTGKEARIGFLNAGDANTNKLTNMQFMDVDNELDLIVNLPKKDRVKCNEELTYPGLCLDTRNVRSTAYVALEFDKARLNLYTKHRGLGQATYFDYVEGNVFVELNQVDTWRYLLDNWFMTYYSTGP